MSCTVTTITVVLSCFWSCDPLDLEHAEQSGPTEEEFLPASSQKHP